MGKLERFALIAEILGGAAVVVSVIYLAVQISDNNRLLRSQSHYNALEVSQRPFEVMMQSATLPHTIVQCDKDPWVVSEADWVQCSGYYFMQVNGWEYTYYQYRDNAVPPELWVGLDGYFADIVQKNAGYVRFWNETAHGFGEPFQSYVARLIQDNPANAASLDVSKPYIED